jgi:hypothetical protein
MEARQTWAKIQKLIGWGREQTVTLAYLAGSGNGYVVIETSRNGNAQTPEEPSSKSHFLLIDPSNPIQA